MPREVKDHDQKALLNYKKALAIDPSTKSAKRFYKKLKSKLTAESRKQSREGEGHGPGCPGDDAGGIDFR